MNSLAETIVLPDLSHSLVGYSINDFYGVPMIMINEPNIKSRSIIFKRSFDILFSTFGLIVLFPMFLVISLIVKFTSKGTVLYSQERMGIDGKKFKMYKFRSMSSDATVNTEGWTVKNDSRITPFGRFLRKSSLDEFPQLWNVLLGNMSLVGPRPERPAYVEKFREEIPTYMLRHKMKAGMTGWAQINGWRGDTSIEKRIECDIYYIRNWSLWMDVTIIVMTFWRGFINKNAY
jgi:exopolysaccharide biosynthesis polyprenyl glycosylphosphotransferase